MSGMSGICVTKPQTPTGLIATGGAGQIVLSWTSTPGAAGYDVAISSDGGSTWGSPINVLTASYTDAAAISNAQASTGQVYYRIRANNSAGSSAFTDGTAHASPWIAETTFPQTNGTNLSGASLEVGGTWSVLSGAWSTTTGSYATQTAATDPSYLTTNTGSADVTVTATINDHSAAQTLGICVRMSDNNNGWLADLGSGTNNFQLFEVVSNVYTFRARTTATISNDTDYPLVVTAAGSTISVNFNNGAATLSYGSATSNQTVTKHGLKAGTTNIKKFKNFRVTSP
jgi:hypothetical protein